MKWMKKVLGSAILGVAALTALHLLAPYTGVEMPVCRLSLAVSAVLGVPGVTLILLLEML